MNIPLQQFYIERPQIDALLEQAVKNPIVTVIAGAGYGKSHAVSSFVHRFPAKLVWIGLHDRDNNGGRFWEDYVAAVRLMNKETAAALTETGFPSTKRKFVRYLSIPDREERFIFVYDDLHLIHNREVLRFLEQSITSPYPNISSVLLSRTEIPINLMGFLSRGLLAKITQEDLKFSEQEMREYFRIRSIRVSEETAGRVYARTEGWAFAIRLAGEVLIRAGEDSEKINWYGPLAFRKNIFKLIEEELLSTVSPELRKFLIKMSLVDVQQADMLRELGNPDIMQELDRVGSFISLDTYMGVYNFHPLLLQYLQNLTEELSEEEKREVYMKAARWCFDNGSKLSAIGYYERAGDYLKLFKMIATLPMLLKGETAKTLLGITLRAPQRIYDEYPAAYIMKTRLLITLARFEEAEKEILGIIALLEKRDDAMTNQKIARALAGLYNNLGLMKSLNCQITRDYGFPRYLRKACDYFAVSHFLPGLPTSVYNVSSYVCRVSIPDRGEMEKYLDALAAAVSYVSVSLGGCAYGLDDLARAELAFYRGDFAGAEEFSHTAIKKAREQNQYEVENRALFFLLRLAFHRGDAGQIKIILKELENQLAQTYFLNRKIYYDIVTGWFYVQIGQPEKIAPWLKSDFEESDLNSILYGQEVIVKARYHFTSLEYPKALASLQSHDEQFGCNAFLMGKIETKALEAVCRYKSGNREECFAVLKEACVLAKPNGFFTAFTELGRDMRTLSSAALDDPVFFKDPGSGGKAGGAGNVVDRELIERLNTAASAYAKRQALIEKEFEPRTKSRFEELSPRERKTLVGLYQGLTGEEIALETDRSINTVKSVIKRIYYKLGALNKADAIRIALETGLLGTEKQDRENGRYLRI
ncbi:MAG: LuxR C-terminal-related transcriptional regulator [Treponema sp.]|jgi:LuxR family maltose regulon positive regulatory protein|nr:LuxR C-terminal-related transcriptional regulator [Treponema sp.]